MLVFARVGAMVMALPVLGTRGISARARLVFALTLTIVLMPMVAEDVMAAADRTMVGLIASLLREVIVGVGLGLSVRLLMGAIQITSTTLAFQMGLAFAQNVDPSQGTQGALFSSFLMMVAITLIFATDTHHLLIGAIHDSYMLFPPAAPLPVGDFASMAISMAAASFRIALQLAAPFIVFGVIFYLGMGVLSRLIPQVQIFFLALPLNIGLGLLMIAVFIGVMMAWFVEHFQFGLSPLLALGS